MLRPRLLVVSSHCAEHVIRVSVPAEQLLQRATSWLGAAIVLLFSNGFGG